MDYLDILIKSIKQQEDLNKLMHDIILIDYDTGNPCHITDIRSGEDVLVIETECSDGTKWKHGLYTEEL